MGFRVGFEVLDQVTTFENQNEKNMKNDMESGVVQGLFFGFKEFEFRYHSEGIIFLLITYPWQCRPATNKPPPVNRDHIR